MLKQQLSLSLLCILLFTGCSVQKASSIKKGHEPQTLSQGQERAVVLGQLGEPQASQVTGDGVIDTYRMNRNSRGWGYFRSGLYGIMNVGSFGLWEILGTPLEGWIQSEQVVTIHYDSNDVIQKITYTR